MSKFELLNILYSDDDWYLPDNIPRLVPKEPNIDTNTKSEENNDEDIIDVTKIAKVSKPNDTEQANPEITVPDGSQTIEVDNEESPPINLEKADTFDWDNPASRDVILDMQLKQESGFNPEAVGAAGEQGMAQFMPSTWEWVKNKGWIGQNESAFNVKSALKAQQAFMNYLVNTKEAKEAESEEERIKRALAGYNAGLGNLRKALRKSKETGDYWLKFMPEVTKNYVASILKNAHKHKDNYTPKFKRNYL